MYFLVLPQPSCFTLFSFLALCLISIQVLENVSCSLADEPVLDHRQSPRALPIYSPTFLFTDLNLPLATSDSYIYVSSDQSQCTPCTNLTASFNYTYSMTSCSTQICLTVNANTGVTNIITQFNGGTIYNLTKLSGPIMISPAIPFSSPIPVTFKLGRRPCFCGPLAGSGSPDPLPCSNSEMISAVVCFNVQSDVDRLSISNDYMVTGDNECSLTAKLSGSKIGCTTSSLNSAFCTTTLAISLQTTYDDVNMVTKFCYAINPNGGTTLINNFVLNLPRVDGLTFINDTSGYWTRPDDSTIQFTFTPALTNSARTPCFTINGMFGDPVTRFMNLRNDVTPVCLKNVQGPGKRVDPIQACGLDANVNNGACGDCIASCTGNLPTVPGSQSCQLRTLTATTYPGLNCTRFSQRPCTKTCLVDCTSVGPTWLTCTSNCKTKTVTQTGYFVVATSAANGGAPCGPLTATRLCSIAPGSSECPPDIDCVVTGIPLNACPNVCSSGGPNIVTATLSYPITITPPSGNGKDCPLYTTACSCSSCSIDSTPYRSAPCTAVCKANDGSFVTGSQNLYYSILTPALNQAPCATAIETSCTSRCLCDYSTSYTLGSCIYTSTLSTATPWTALGIQSWAKMGFVPECNSVLNAECQGVLPPVNCVPTYSCLTTQCTPTFGADYVLSTLLSCSTGVLTSSSYGGQTCNSVPTETLYSKVCPGCNYNWVCGCQYTVSNSAFGTTSATGTVVCTGSLDANAVAPAFCPTTYVSPNPTSACQTTIKATTCAYTTVACENTCVPTSTNSNVIPWTVYGMNLCTYSDPRLEADRPQTCTQYSSSASCSKSLQAMDCATANICKTFTPACAGAVPTPTLLTNVDCKVVIQKDAQNGGAACPLGTTYKGNVMATCSVPTATPTPTGYFGAGNPFNCLIFGDASCTDSSVDGRLAVGGKANLINFNIGQKLSQISSCGLNPPEALRVGGDLLYVGTVANGVTDVGGSCNDGISATCQITCNLATNGICDPNAINYPALKSKLTTLGQSLAQKPSSATVTSFYGNTVAIAWSGSAIERILIPRENSSPVLPFNSYTGLLLNTATVVITVLGDHPILNGFDLSYFSERAAYVLWNFPEASIVEITAMTVYGTILAPNAQLIGSGTIVGQVFAASLACSDNQSLKIQSAPFLGTL